MKKLLRKIAEKREQRMILKLCRAGYRVSRGGVTTSLNKNWKK